MQLLFQCLGVDLRITNFFLRITFLLFIIILILLLLQPLLIFIWALVHFNLSIYNKCLTKTTSCLHEVLCCEMLIFIFTSVSAAKGGLHRKDIGYIKLFEHSDSCRAIFEPVH